MSTATRRHLEDCQGHDAQEPSAKRAETGAGENEASSSKSNYEILQDLICPLCCDIFTAPISLPLCGHTFCGHCVHSLPLSGGHAPGLNCPQCWQFNPKPSEGWHVDKSIRNTLKQIERHHSQLSSNQTRKMPGQGPSIEQICPHLPTPTSGHEDCNHCKRKFCPSCRLLHMKSLKEESLKNAEKAIEESEKFLPDQVLQELKALIDESSAEARRNLTDAVNKLRAKLDTCLDGITNDLSSKISTLAQNNLKKNERLIDGLSDKASLDQFNKEFRTTSEQDVDQLTLKGLAEFNSKISNRMRDLKTLKLPAHGPLFKVLKKLSDKKMSTVCEKIEGLTFGQINITKRASELVDVPSDLLQLQMKQGDQDRNRSSNGDRYIYERQEVEEDKDDKDYRFLLEEDESSSESEWEYKKEGHETSEGRQGDKISLPSGKAQTETKVFEKQHPAKPVNPEETIPLSIVSLEYKSLTGSKCVVALNSSYDNEFVALHGSNQLAIFNSKGFVCDMKLELSSGDQTSLQVDAIYPSKRRRVLATATINKTERKLYLVSIVLEESNGCARMYELASSRDLQDFKSVLDEGLEVIFVTHSNGTVSAYHTASNNAPQHGSHSHQPKPPVEESKQLRKFDIVLVEAGCRLVGCEVRCGGWYLFLSGKQSLHCLDMTFKPQNVNKKFVIDAIQNEIFSISGSDSILFKDRSSHASNIMVLTKGPVMQIFHVAVPALTHDKCSVKKSATYGLPFAGCSSVAFLDRKNRGNRSLLQSPLCLPESYRKPESQRLLAVLTKTGSIALIPVPSL